MNVLVIGDIVGKTRRKMVFDTLPGLIVKHEIDLCIANVENAAGGFGITPQIAQQFLEETEIHVLTSGNHIWDKKEIEPFLANEPRLLRPANYPDGVPGKGSILVQTASGKQVGVMNLSGRIFMESLDCPFKAAQQELTKLKEKTNIIMVDFHAEATSEKIAMGWFLDGQVSAVIGTHTHVATADEKILPGGTAYISDIGMTGPHDSVIGLKKEIVLKRFLTRMPVRFDAAKRDVQLNGVLIQVDDISGKAQVINRIQLKP